MAESCRSLRAARRSGAALLLPSTACALALAACGGGGGGGGGPADLHPPDLRFASFQSDVTAVQAGSVAIAWVAADEDDEATVSIFADADGDAGTTADRHTLVDEVTEQNGMRQEARGDLGPVPGGSYVVLGRIRDGKGGEQTVAAPGRLIVEDRALVAPIGGQGIEIVAHLPREDGSFDLLGRYRGVVDFDPRHRRTSASRTWDVFVARYTKRAVIRWLSVFESTGDMTASAIVRDADGSLLIAGSFGGTLTLPDQSTVRGSGVDAFVARLSAEGEPLWVRSASSPNGDVASDLALLADGSFVVAGAFCLGNTTYPIDFGTDRNGQPVTLSSAGVGDAFVVRYESDGRPVWASSAGGPTTDRATAVAVLDGDRVVVGGAFEGSAAFGDGSIQHTASGDADGFVAEWTGAGALVRVDVLAGLAAEEVVDLARCAGGDLLVLANSTSAELDVAGTTLQLATDLDCVLARFEPDGDLRWAIGAAVGPGPCKGERIEPLADDALLLAGTYADGARFGPGGPTLPVLGATDAFASKIGPDGSLHWLRRFASADPERGLAISARPDGTVLVTGERGATDLVVSTQRGDVTLPATPSTALFAARFNPDGELGRSPELASRVAGPATIARGRVTVLVDGLIATWTGFDDVETTPAVRQLVEQHPMVALLVVQRADGPIRGSAHLDGARAIAAAGLETHIPSNGSAYGGGIDLFLGGRRRTAAEGANVTVRSWVDENRMEGHGIRGDRNHPAHAPWLEFYDALGVPRDYYWFYLEAPRNAPRRLTRAEIEQYSIVTD